jgi:hypothetical protein
MKLLHGIVPTLQLLFAGLTNAVQYFTNGLQVNYAMQQRWSAAMKAMQLTNWVGLIVAIGAAIYNLASRTDEYTKKINDAVKKAGEYSEATEREQRKLDELYGTLKGAKEGTKAYEDAKTAIISQYAKYLEGLISEKGEILNLEAAYNRLTVAIQRSAKERAISDAKKDVDDTYIKDFTDNKNGLKDALLKYGVSEAEASELVQKVSQAIANGAEIPKAVQERINSLGQKSASEIGDGILDHIKAGIDKSQFGAALDVVYGSSGGRFTAKTPAEYVNDLIKNQQLHKSGMEDLEAMNDVVNPMRHIDTNTLKLAIESLSKIAENGEAGNAPVWTGGQQFELKLLTPAQAMPLLKKYNEELALRGTGGTKKTVEENKTLEYEKYITDKDRKKAETAAEKAKREFKKKLEKQLDEEKAIWESKQATNLFDYAKGKKEYEEYIEAKEKIDEEYLRKRMKVYKKAYKYDETKLQSNEDYQALVKQYAEAKKKHADEENARKVQNYQKTYKDKQKSLDSKYNSPYADEYKDEVEYARKTLELKIEYLMKYRDVYKKGSKEYLNWQQKIDEAYAADRLSKEKKWAELYTQWLGKYDEIDFEKKLKYNLSVLDDLFKEDIISTEDYDEIYSQITKNIKVQKEDWQHEYDGKSDKKKYEVKKKDDEKTSTIEELEKEYKKGLLTEEEYNKRKAQIASFYQKQITELVTSGMDSQTAMLWNFAECWANVWEKISEGGKFTFDDLQDLASTTFATMGAALETYSQFAQAEYEIKLAKTEKYYDSEIERAEGNSYKVTKLEKEKEEKISKLKSEASEREFNMKVIEAVAQTAQNALAAYGSAAAIPVTGYILAPIAAAAATASGLVQVALLKKQQQAAEAQGYAEGGFTPQGGKYEEVGVVHAGEWVASQELLASPVARPLINALDYVQRTNTIGSLNAADVSRSITAPQSLTMLSEGDSSSVLVAASIAKNSETMNKLVKRLEKPFITVNTVTGSLGIKQAQDEYETLIRNKSGKR